jgi:hypothetical protein
MSTVTATIVDTIRQTRALAAALDDVRAFVRRFVVLSSHQAVAVTLWIAHTHVVDAAECTPYLQVTSATKGAGKTRLLEVVEPLVARPWLTGRTSAAALARKMDAEHPTLLLDESDAAFKGEKEYSETLRGVLNTGYRRSGKTTLCVGQGAKFTVRDFATFGPKAIAGIGKLPDTVADRAIPIALRRRTADEPCERWRERDGQTAAAPVRDALVAALAPLADRFADARPAIPPTLGDRQADVWEPLFVIADAAGADWTAAAERAATTLVGEQTDDDVVVELLTDLRAILADDAADVWPSADLIAKLVADEVRPWATWRKDEKPITGRGLARLLAPLGIVPDRHQTPSGQVRGYRRDAFDDAIARYLPICLSKCQNVNNDGPEPAISKCLASGRVDTLKSDNTPIETGEKTLRHIEPGLRGNGGDRARF